MTNAVLVIKDGNADPQNMGLFNIGASSETLLVPAHVLVDQYGNPLGTAGNPNIIGQADTVVAASFSRPANTTAYVAGQLVANNVLAAAVVPMTLAVAITQGASVRLKRARLTKNSTATSNAIFRAHIYKKAPVTITGGDGQTWQTSGALDYLGSFTFDMTGANARIFTDGVKVITTPDVGTEQIIETSSTTTDTYALLEALAAYTPASGETFTLALEVTQD